MIDRGLDLSRLDETSEDEVAGFRAHYSAHHGKPLAGYEFWLAIDPGQVKRHRLQARWSADAEGLALPLHGTLAFLHLYAILPYEAGIRYELLHARSLGCVRSGIVETLALAFVHSGPRGMHAANDGALDILEEWSDERTRCTAEVFPSNWTWQPDMFRLGFDYTSAEWSKADRSRMHEWYHRYLGGTPEYAKFLLASRPGVLKAWWARSEGAMRGSLPVQMFPFFMIHLNVSRGFAPGIREGAILGRSLGMTASQIGEAIAWGGLYGGPAGIAIAAEATRDVL